MTPRGGNGGAPVIAVKEVEREYEMGGERVHALAGVTFTVERGEYVAIMGPSGSGKSTLMNILGCLDTPSRGEYWLDGRRVSGLSEHDLARVRNRDIGFVFQTFHLLPRATTQRNVELPLLYAGVPAAARRGRATAALERVGLGARLRHRPNQLSGGQCQRVAIARALVTGPALLLADEPTGNLDSRTGEEVMALFEALHGEGHTIVLVTHDPGLAARAARRIVLHDGRIAEDERADRGRAEPRWVAAGRRTS
jgi:putative ABC transport system ATP-binding protein